MIKIKLSKLQGFIQGEWNWPISCLNDSETQERGLKTFPGKQAHPPPPPEDCAFGARFGNRSVFILDLRLESTPACGLLDFPTPACCFNRIHCSKLWRTEVTNNVFTSQVQRSLESNIPSYMKAYY